MYTIYKYVIDPGLPSVMMPKGARVLSAGNQHDQLCVWAHVEADAPLIPHRIDVYGTGHPAPVVPGRFVGTVLMLSGKLVLHVHDGGEILS